jgi:hypothetical protein
MFVVKIVSVYPEILSSNEYKLLVGQSKKETSVARISKLPSPSKS